MKIFLSCLVLACAIPGCGDNKPSPIGATPAPLPTNPPSAPATPPDTATPDTATPAGVAPSAAEPTANATRPLCIDPGDLEVEPLDLEALDDEAPAPELPAPVTRRLASFTAHGSAIALGVGGRGDFLAPVLRCQAARCTAGVLTLDSAGADKSFTPLPGLGDIPVGTPLQMTAVRADIDGDGTSDLWLGYEVGAPASEPTQQHMAALSLPSARVQWHQMVGRGAPKATDEGCDGAVYPVDADCDGDGDLVLIRRCGPMRCLNDDGDSCDGLAETSALFSWSPEQQLYRALQPPR